MKASANQVQRKLVYLHGMNERRWDIDQRGRGIDDAAEHLPALQAFADAMQSHDWVAEDPQAHLLPHIEASCRALPNVWRLAGTETDVACFVVRLGWLRALGDSRQLTRDVYTLLGAIAENGTFLHMSKRDGMVVVEVTTGMLDGEGPFRGHGHTLRLEVRGAAIERWSGL
jgi:hypothetical protein